MRCVYCDSANTRVIDKRDSEGTTRRRRECLKCENRFTTYERPESLQLFVIKKDKTKEPYIREKLYSGLVKAFEKRPVDENRINSIVAEIEAKIKPKKEVKSSIIGDMVIRKLRTLDKIAYIRFASVYRSFDDIKEFEREVRTLKK